MEAIETGMDLPTFAEKLKSLSIQPERVAPPDDRGGEGYDISRALTSWYTGDRSLAPKEMAYSTKVLSDPHVPITGRREALAMPFEELLRLSSTLSGVGHHPGKRCGLP